MSSNSVEKCVRELQKSIEAMHNRLISLESVVTEQNALIEVLTQKNDLVGQSPLNENITPNTGRPRRAAQVQALSAITAGARNKIGVQKPKVPPSQSFAGRVRVPNGNKASKTTTHSDDDVSARAPRGPEASPPQTVSAPATPLPAHQSPPSSGPANNMSNNKSTDYTSIDINEGSWIIQQSKKRQKIARQSVIKGCGQHDLLKTVERSKKIHICFLKPETQPEIIKQHMTSISPDDNYSVEKLTIKHNYYASFALTVPESKYKIFMTAENWPPRTEVSEWFRYGAGHAAGPHRGVHRSRKQPGQTTESATNN
ncbi:hypothetical protein O0L34_g18017 [Tuta absoluta]|nr:hypothetical protein O0L34_g18017 [Tuta absoluta]